MSLPKSLIGFDPVVACVGAQALASLLITWNFGPALAGIVDSDLFDPTGLMTLEVFRILRYNLLDTAVESALLALVAWPCLALCHLWLLYANVSQLTAAPRSGSVPKLRPLLDFYPSYLLVHALGWLAMVGTAALGLLGCWTGYRLLNQGISEWKLGLLAVAGLVFSLFVVILLIAVDSLKLSLSCVPTSSVSTLGRLRALLRALRPTLTRLVWFRGLRIAASCALLISVGTVYRASSMPPFVSALLAQVSIYLVVQIEAFWYRKLGGALLLDAQVSSPGTLLPNTPPSSHQPLTSQQPPSSEQPRRSARRQQLGVDLNVAPRRAIPRKVPPHHSPK